jgi:hypothetical protein
MMFDLCLFCIGARQHRQALTVCCFCCSYATALGDVAVQPADSEQDRYTAINGKCWRNWGLTVKEQAERYVKFLRTGEVPERTLPIALIEEGIILEVTARGR